MKKRKKIFIVVGIIFVIISSLFILRNNFLRFFLTQAQEKFKVKYNAEVLFKGAYFIGLNTIKISDIVLVAPTKDTLLFVVSVHCKINSFDLLYGGINLNELIISDAKITPVRTDSADNFSFLWKSKKKESQNIEELNHAKLLHKLIESIFAQIPQKVNCENLSFIFLDGNYRLEFTIPLFSFSEKKLYADILVNVNKRDETWTVQGIIDKRNKNMFIKLFSNTQNKRTVFLPYIIDRWNTKISFDTIQFNLNKESYFDEKLQLTGSFNLFNFKINHLKISQQDVLIKNITADYSITVGKNSVVLDSSSLFTLNKLPVHPFVNYQHFPEKEITLKANFKNVSAEDFFESLPSGMFQNLEGIKANGSLSYKLDFFVNMNNPDSLHFSSDFKKENFKLKNFGQSDLTRINKPFEYTAYEKGQAVRTFAVGTENPNFTTISNISEILKNCVLTSEDGDFFYHRGFNEEMFAKSIAANIKAGRFVRGGSTISMQLVKNVFLKRDKIIARKLEEVLLVWLIENEHLISKERMLEVYLNIIEWGPNIYGVGEASHFYFAKKPVDLTLAESIFLASIIPSPKMFKYSFDENGNLKGSLAFYYKLISGILLRKMVITEMEHEQLQPTVELKGRAKILLLPKDSISNDSTLIERMEFLK